MLLDLLKRLFKALIPLVFLFSYGSVFAESTQLSNTVTFDGTTFTATVDTTGPYNLGLTNFATSRWCLTPDFNGSISCPISGGGGSGPVPSTEFTYNFSTSTLYSQLGFGSLNAKTVYIVYFMYYSPPFIAPDYKCDGTSVNANATCYYASFYWDGFELSALGETTGGVDYGSYVPPSVNAWDTEYIDINKPVFGTTTATTTIDIEVFFSTPLTLDFRPTTSRRIVISDALTGEVEWLYDYPIPPNAGESITVATTTTLTEGSKDIQAYYVTETGVEYSEIARSFFNIITNTYEAATGLNNPLDRPEVIDCNTYDIACQFQRALVFVFVPDAGFLNKFSNLWQTLRTKIPFGYVTVTIDQLSLLNTNALGEYNLGTLPFKDAIFTPLKTALGLILWGLFAIYFYHARLKKLEI